MNIPKVSKEVGCILKFQRVHKSPPSSSPILSKIDSKEEQSSLRQYVKSYKLT